MPSDTFRHTAVSPADPDAILAALETADTWRGIGPIDDVWDATHDGDRLSGFRWSARAAGKSWEGSARRADAPAGALALDLDSPEVAGMITVSVIENGAGSDVAVELEARSKGLLAGMFWGVISDALSRGLSEQVEAFASGFSD